MKTKKLYISPAIRAHKLRIQVSVLAASTVETQVIEESTGTPSDVDQNAKSGRFTYDGFGTKSNNSSSYDWK